MIRLVTIEREYGSGGAEIAQMVAHRLGWKLWDQALTDEIARVMDCPKRAVEEHEERCDSLYYRLFRSFMRGSFEGSLNAPKMKPVDADCISRIARQVVLNAAREGNGVLVGRGSAYFLHDRADALHVFVYAPFDEKVRRLKARGKSQSEAQELAETVDRERAEYIKKYFEVDWPDRGYFHLMMNTVLGDEIVVETILRSVHALDEQPA
ncbi:MAG TPA: cytidylate kinase-like family protein [Bryobacteraceae bacterium]|nr:cytidylate kinase-like family protein [Bryobacteraceae bacterium]